MANDDAWQAGLDIASGKNGGHKKKKKGNADKRAGKGKAASTASGAKSGGGNPFSILHYLPKLHKGGKVKKTGAYRLRKGETVVTAKQMKAVHGKKTTRKRVSGKA